MITNFLKQVNGYSGNNVIVEKQIVLKSSCTGEGGGGVVPLSCGMINISEK